MGNDSGIVVTANFEQAFEGDLKCANTASGLLELDEHRITALLDEISDPGLQKKLMRIMLEIVNADHRLTAGEASLIALALERWGIDLCGMIESSSPRHCPPMETPIYRGSTACNSEGSHHVATG